MGMAGHTRKVVLGAGTVDHHQRPFLAVDRLGLGAVEHLVANLDHAAGGGHVDAE